jgi:hypothetical protein
MRRRRCLLAIAMLCLLTALLGMSLSERIAPTPPATAQTRATLASGTLAHPVGATFSAHGGAGSTTAIDRLCIVQHDIQPSGVVVWQHRGPLWGIVTQGMLTVNSGASRGCHGVVYPAGSAFFAPGNHLHAARNESGVPFRVFAVFMLPDEGSTDSERPTLNDCPL